MEPEDNKVAGEFKGGDLSLCKGTGKFKRAVTGMKILA